MTAIQQFDPLFASCLPETFSILMTNGLMVHSSVTQITLHGSRGLARNNRPDSDIDLSLLVLFPAPPIIDEELGLFLKEVVDETLIHWRGPVMLDIAAIFSVYPCSFICFQKTAYDHSLCTVGGKDCFGIYKVQKGFSGFVLNAGIRVERMYPCITIWKKPEMDKYLSEY